MTRRTPSNTARQAAVCVAATAAVLGLAACGGNDHDDPRPVACAELAGLTIPATSIGLPTTGATVTNVEVVAAAGTGPTAVGEYCKVLGDIHPVDPSAPAIKFQLNLPAEADWNRKAMMFGGGGYNGTIATGAGNVPAGPVTQPVPLGRGYATFGSDSGHQAGPTTSRDGSFGLNDEALANFGGDALKKTRDTAIAILTKRYGRGPERSYFAGGSTGGREALIAVGRWPADFDGAIVLYPAWDAISLDLKFGQFTRALAQPGAYPNQAKRKTMYDAAMQACDALDGAGDGLISDPVSCHASFDPDTALLDGAPLRCAGGADLGDSCLSDAQIAGFRSLDSAFSYGYALASGETSYPGFNTWGSDFGMTGSSPLQPTVVTLALGTLQPASPMPAVTASGSPPYGSTFWDQWARYILTRNPDFDSLSLDPANPGTYQSRIVYLSGIGEATADDLSPFKARGGKLLIAHGMGDVLVSNRSTQRYMARLRAAMGDAAVTEFARYYEIPGYGHAASSVFNASWDSVTALEDWVERGTAPVNPVVADTAGVPGRTRPLCEYPAWPRYLGSGDVNLAASFECHRP